MDALTTHFPLNRPLYCHLLFAPLAVFVIFGAATHWVLMFFYVLPWHAGTAVPGTR